jgi:hypothetical protein
MLEEIRVSLCSEREKRSKIALSCVCFRSGLRKLLACSRAVDLVHQSFFLSSSIEYNEAAFYWITASTDTNTIFDTDT